MDIIASIDFTPFVTAFAAALIAAIIAAIIGGSIVIVRIGRCKA